MIHVLFITWTRVSFKIQEYLILYLLFTTFYLLDTTIMTIVQIMSYPILTGALKWEREYALIDAK